MGRSFVGAYASHAFKDYFGAKLPETEAERLNFEAVRTVLEGLSRRKTELLRLIYTDEAERIPEAVKAVSWDEEVPEFTLWQLIRLATRKFSEVRVL